MQEERVLTWLPKTLALLGALLLAVFTVGVSPGCGARESRASSLYRSFRFSAVRVDCRSVAMGTGPYCSGRSAVRRAGSAQQVRLLLRDHHVSCRRDTYD